MKLRAHHLFCTTLFSGHGYDRAFAEKMAAVISARDAGEAFCLCEGADEVCGACPNRLEGEKCALGTEDVLQRDREAFRVLGLVPGTACSGADALRRLSRLAEADFLAVCGGCRWAQEGYCSFRLLQERTAEKSGET